MEKPARTGTPIHDLLARRWSPRAFGGGEVELEKLHAVFEAARWAPSSYNEQPWRFLVATRDDEDGYGRMLECMVEFNRSWARTAPVLFLSVASLRFARNGKDNRHALHDVGLATQNLAVEATARGLHVHMMAGFDPARAREVFGIPEGFEPVAMGALGYMGALERLPGELREKERAARERRPLEESLRGAGWDRPSPLLSRP